MATHSSILAWRIPWTEEFGGLQSMGHKESDITEKRLSMHHKNENFKKLGKSLKDLRQTYSLPVLSY